MPLIQFFAVHRRDGSIDTRHIIMAEFDQETGKLLNHTLDIPADRSGAIIRINRQEYKRQVALHGLRRAVKPDEERKAARKKRDQEYRAELIRKRPRRETRAVSEGVRDHVIERIAAGDSGVAISLSTGVSTTYISRLKHKLKAGR